MKNVTFAKKDYFINDILEVYKKHGLCLSHEDSHGAFLVVPYDQYFVDWLKETLKYEIE